MPASNPNISDIIKSDKLCVSVELGHEDKTKHACFLFLAEPVYQEKN